jgi:hypothetical protein
MITAKQVWTEVFRLDRDNRQVDVVLGESGLPAITIANPDEHFYVEVNVTPEDAETLAAKLIEVARRGRTR